MRDAKTLGLIVVLAVTIGLSACGRKGPLEPPPGKSALLPDLSLMLEGLLR